MATVTEWFGTLPPMMRVYWGLAIFASVIFAIQMMLTFLGIGDTDSADADFGGDMGDGDTLDTGGALQLFTIRNFINFFLGVGWGGVCLAGTIHNPVLLGLVSLLVGCAFVGIFVFLFRQLMRLESNGNFRIQACQGVVCDVYLRIPAHRQGQGRVQISVGGSVHELPAMTDGELLPTGTKVRVTQVLDSSTLLVESCN